MRMYFRTDIADANVIRLYVGQTLKKTVPALQDEFAQDVLDLAQQLAPVETGSLRDSGHLEEDLESSARRMIVVFGNPDGGYHGSASRAAGAPVDYAAAVEYGTVKSPAQPFLTPAAEELYPLFVQKVADALRGGQ